LRNGRKEVSEIRKREAPHRFGTGLLAGQSHRIRRRPHRREDGRAENVLNASDPQLRVSVEMFDGPLDLLLSLVKERQLDIATVPLASVAEQYLEYVSMMEAIDVEAAAEYLVI